ncbi:MAG: type II secretion system F family protein [Planctomycetales bacterium]|nr:type II secretion system F family protein [Planctomycetales bacterium]
MTTLNFSYKVRDSLGKSSEGKLTAASRDEATAKLRKDGLQVVELAEEDEELELLPKRIKQSDIIFLTSQLAVMVDTGITLSVAIKTIADQEENKTLKKVLVDLETRVEGGEDFSAALARHDKYFDRTYVSLVKASEHTGTLGEMLENIADHLRKQLETRQKVQAAMAYPGIMLVLAIGVTTFMLTYVLPKFTPLFNRKGMKLPVATKVLMALSDNLLHYWYLWLLGIVALILAYVFGRKTEVGRKLLDSVKLNLPILGQLNRKIIISRSMRTLGTMIGAGVSMLDAIRLAADVSGNVYYEVIWMHVLDQITQGKRVAESLAGNKLFPSTLVQMISSGEETGKLDKVLAKVSTYYDREVESSIKAATSMIEPILIVGMGIIVGSIAMGLLLPIFQLSKPGH